MSDFTTVFARRFAARAECSCGWTAKQRMLRGAAIADAMTHTAITGHMPGWPLVICDTAAAGTRRMLTLVAVGGLIAAGAMVATADPADALPGQCGGGYGLGNGGTYCDFDAWPDGSFMHQETVCVLGFCGTNAFRACHAPGAPGMPAGRVPTDSDPSTPC